MRSICTAVVATLVLVGTSFAATINVPADYTTIQAAIDAASDGDEILVAPGTYTSTQDGHVVDMKAKAITLRSTDGAAVTLIDGQNARRGIACYQGEPNTTVINGFTITNGYSAEYDYDGDGSGGWWEGNGGGIACFQNSNPTITDCTISDNTADPMNGGGIACYYSSPTISGCTITNNTATYPFGTGGGGIFCDNGSPTITGCMITGNSALGGSGIYCLNSSPTITGCEISGNTANDNGGGIFCSGSSSPTLTACIISDNFAGALGGGIEISSGSSCGLQATSICSNVPAESQVSGDYTDNGGNTIAEFCPWYQGACCTGNELACVVATEEDCEHFGLTWLGEGTTCDDSPCPTSCLGDINEDGQVSTNDLLTVIANWGPCP